MPCCRPASRLLVCLRISLPCRPQRTRRAFLCCGSQAWGSIRCGWRSRFHHHRHQQQQQHHCHHQQQRVRCRLQGFQLCGSVPACTWALIPAAAQVACDFQFATCDVCCVASRDEFIRYACQPGHEGLGVGSGWYAGGQCCRAAICKQVRKTDVILLPCYDAYDGNCSLACDI